MCSHRPNFEVSKLWAEAVDDVVDNAVSKALHTFNRLNYLDSSLPLPWIRSMGGFKGFKKLSNFNYFY